MRFATGFARFWWDFIVGDDWRIAVGVVVVLAAGALLVSGGGVSDHLVAAVVAVGIILVAIASIVTGARGTRSSR
jgi:hypothetical protein